MDSHQTLDLKESVIETLTYSNYYDYPLTLDELYLNLGTDVDRNRLQTLLQNNENLQQEIGKTGDYYHLKQRQEIVKTREKRKRISRLHWTSLRDLVFYLRRIPFVDMVAVTGSLAVNNSNPNSDIDLFVICKSRRVWMTRLLLYFVEKFVERTVDKPLHLCFNYITTIDFTNNLKRNIYIARELYQMKPILGLDTYIRILRNNTWIAEKLPNIDLDRHISRVKQFYQDFSSEPKTYISYILEQSSNNIVLDALLRGIDYLEYRRATSKIFRNFEINPESNFTINEYKAHFHDHQQKVIDYLSDDS